MTAPAPTTRDDAKYFIENGKPMRNIGAGDALAIIEDMPETPQEAWAAGWNACAEAALAAAIGAGGQAVEAPAVNGGGSIKALEWTSHRGWPQTAKSVVGKYQIWAGKDLWLNDEQLPGDDDIGGVHYKSLDEAKAAAQRDYETRILSALER